MTNTMNQNEKTQQAAAAIYADLKANNVKANNQDEMFEAVKKYVTITREQFDDYFNQMNENRELDETELDMVAGGSFKDFLCSPLGMVSIIAAGVLVGTGIGAAAFGVAALFAGGGAAAAGATAATAVSAGATAVATVGQAAAIGGFFGFFGGCAATCVTSLALNPSTGTN